MQCMYLGFVPSHGSLSVQDSPIYIIPVHDTRGASAFGISRAYYQIAVSNCTLYLCLGRQTSNDYFTNGQMYYFGAPGFGETAFVAITEMAIWLMYETVFGSLFKRNYQTWWVSILLWKWACVNGILALQSGEYGPISIVYIYTMEIGPYSPLCNVKVPLTQAHFHSNPERHQV